MNKKLFFILLIFITVSTIVKADSGAYAGLPSIAKGFTDEQKYFESVEIDQGGINDLGSDDSYNYDQQFCDLVDTCVSKVQSNEIQVINNSISNYNNSLDDVKLQLFFMWGVIILMLFMIIYLVISKKNVKK